MAVLQTAQESPVRVLELQESIGNIAPAAMVKRIFRCRVGGVEATDVVKDRNLSMTGSGEGWLAIGCSRWEDDSGI